MIGRRVKLERKRDVSVFKPRFWLIDMHRHLFSRVVMASMADNELRYQVLRHSGKRSLIVSSVD